MPKPSCSFGSAKDFCYTINSFVIVDDLGDLICLTDSRNIHCLNAIAFSSIFYSNYAFESINIELLYSFISYSFYRAENRKHLKPQ